MRRRLDAQKLRRELRRLVHHNITALDLERPGYAQGTVERVVVDGKECRLVRPATHFNTVSTKFVGKPLSELLRSKNPDTRKMAYEFLTSWLLAERGCLQAMLLNLDEFDGFVAYTSLVILLDGEGGKVGLGYLTDRVVRPVLWRHFRERAVRERDIASSHEGKQGDELTGEALYKLTADMFCKDLMKTCDAIRGPLTPYLRVAVRHDLLDFVKRPTIGATGKVSLDYSLDKDGELTIGDTLPAGEDWGELSVILDEDLRAVLKPEELEIYLAWREFPDSSRSALAKALGIPERTFYRRWRGLLANRKLARYLDPPSV